ncbi:MAG: zf-HC2 domain-containing protein [Bacteroidales bacterium]
MKKCTKKYSYFDYLEGALKPSEREAFEKHLAGCVQCQENLFRIQEFLAKIEEDKTFTASPYTYTRIMGRIEQNRLSEARFRKWQPAIIGIVSVVAVMVGMLLGNYFFKNTAQYASYLNLNETRQEIIELSLLNNN